MATIVFKPTSVEGVENIMDTSGIDVSAISFNRESREIIIHVGGAFFDEQELQDMSWQAVKKLVEENGGTWTNKSEGIEFLLGL